MTIGCEVRSAWQIAQGKKCGCMGVDEYCPCQNTDRTSPSPTNTAGLEVVAWRFRTAPDRSWHRTNCPKIIEQERADGSECEPDLVTAASAEARIAELEAELEEARTIDAGFWKWLGERDLQPDGPDVDWGDIVVALTEHEDNAYDLAEKASDRAQAAEARADRLAGALLRAADDLRDIGKQKPQPTTSPDPEHENYLRRVLISLGQVGNARARTALEGASDDR